ncbi:MAG TPA: hypothetical protein VL053_15790 [Arachidicoccus sp.]|nr:hypothetical protein [Arachidicoccus sp.]
MRIRFLPITCSLLTYMTLLSCGGSNTTMQQTEPKSTNWYISGHLPDDSAGQPSLGLAGPVTGISHHYLLIGGGSNFAGGFPWAGGKKSYYNQLFIYKIVSAANKDTLQLLQKKYELPYSVAYSANCTTAKGIIVAGGENETGLLNKVLLLNIDTTNDQLIIKHLPDLPFPSSAGMLAAIENTLYFAGGGGPTGTSDQLLQLNLDSLGSGWQQLPDLPRAVAYGLLYGLPKQGQLYLVGGRKANKDSTSSLYAAVDAYDIHKKKWMKKPALPYALSAQTGLLVGNKLMVYGGDQGATFHKTEQFILAIAREKDEKRRQILILEKNSLQEAHPGFSPIVLAYDLDKEQWIRADSIPFPSQVTTTAVRFENLVIIPSGEIRAGVRTPAVITHKIN